MAKDPAVVTVYGRLSYPTWTHAEAVKRNSKSEYPKDDPTKVSPSINVLLEQAQMDKFVNHLKDVFLPFVIARETAGEKKNALSAKDAARVLKVLDDLEDQPPYIPLKVVGDKTLDLMPTALASLKINGPQNADFVQKAIVRSEADMLVPDPDYIGGNVIRPLRQTIFQMYGGCEVAVTVNLYAYLSGKVPGITASASTVVFRGDADSFGGGVAVDEEAIFLDD